MSIDKTLEHYVQALADLEFQHAEKLLTPLGEASILNESGWRILINSLGRLVTVEAAYFSWSFSKRKWFRRETILTTYTQIQEDLAKCGQLFRTTVVISGKSSTSLSSLDLISKFVAQLEDFLVARKELIQIYNLLYNYIALGTLQDNIMKFLRTLHMNLQRSSEKFNLPLLSPLKKIYDFEIKSLWHACCTQFFQNQLDMTEAVIHLNEFLGHLEAWKQDRSRRKSNTSQLLLSVSSQDFHLFWLAQMATYLVSRQTILFHKPLNISLHHNDSFYLLLEKMINYKPELSLSIYVIADGIESLHHAKAHLNSVAWFKSFILQTGYTLPGPANREDVEDYTGLKLFPCLFAFPIDKSTSLGHWPKIVSIIQDLDQTFIRELQGSENNVPDSIDFGSIKVFSPDIHSYHDRRSNFVYFLGEMSSSILPSLKQVHPIKKDFNSSMMDSSSSDRSLFYLPSPNHPRPKIWSVLVIEDRDPHVNPSLSSPFWVTLSRDSQLKEWMQQWIRLFRLTILSDLLVALTSK